ncbi:unnamed protein product [Blepharisma stoltei]|uniref:Uncharacterized protein n=1 Tax=Blepharisma stoltei TaxID=1481888 RepID=A0AAU9IXH2_9CILI|nr:unnamed protein product [Blepharisma stoltei]
MGFWDYFTRTFDEQESVSQQPTFQSSVKSSKIICKPDQEGQMRCTKCTTTKGSDENGSWVEEDYEELPYNEGFKGGYEVEDEIFKEMENMMQRFMRPFMDFDREEGGLPSFFRGFSFREGSGQEDRYFGYREQKKPYGYDEGQHGFGNARFGEG